MALHRHYFEVTGFGRFPLDMLRYDGCFPAHSDDTGRIDDALRGDVPQTPIRLLHVGDNKHWTPTYERWGSFMWKVVTFDGRAV